MQAILQVASIKHFSKMIETLLDKLDKPQKEQMLLWLYRIEQHLTQNSTSDHQIEKQKISEVCIALINETENNIISKS